MTACVTCLRPEDGKVPQLVLTANINLQKALDRLNMQMELLHVKNNSLLEEIRDKNKLIAGWEKVAERYDKILLESRRVSDE